MRSSQFKIKEYTEGKKRGFIVYGYLKLKNEKGNPKRIRKKFPDRETALDYRHMLEVREKQDKINYRFRESKITDEDEHLILSLAEEIRQQENDHQSSFRDLVRKGLRFYIDSPVKGLETLTLSQAKEKFCKQKKFIKRSKPYTDGVKRCLENFCNDHQNRNIATISNIEIEEWIYSRRESGEQTKLSEYRFLHVFFEWCKKKAIVNRNVVTMVDKPEIEIKEPVSLTISEVKNLLVQAESIDKMSMLPYFAIGIFAGVRPREMIRAEWEDFDWDEEVMRVRQRKGGRFTRSVELPSICMQWLDHCGCRKKSGDFTPTNHKKLFNLIRACSGFRISKSMIQSMNKFGKQNLIEDCDSKSKPIWINDLMRHTAITYRLKKVKHIGEVAEWAGNSPEIIKRNYKSVKGVSNASTKEFFSLTPSKILKN